MTKSKYSQEHANDPLYVDVELDPLYTRKTGEEILDVSPKEPPVTGLTALILQASFGLIKSERSAQVLIVAVTALCLAGAGFFLVQTFGPPVVLRQPVPDTLPGANLPAYSPPTTLE